MNSLPLIFIVPVDVDDDHGGMRDYYYDKSCATVARALSTSTASAPSTVVTLTLIGRIRILTQGMTVFPSNLITIVMFRSPHLAVT